MLSLQTRVENLKKLFATLLISSLLLILQSCANPGQRIVSDGCFWSSYIYLSDADILTKETERAILAQNETRKKKCGIL